MKLFDQDLLREFGVVEYGQTQVSIPYSLDHYNLWVKNNRHLPLTYLEGERQEKRQDLKKYWPQYKSALVFLFSYHESHQKLQSIYKSDKNWNGLKLASYTLGFNGDDYHFLIKERLQILGKELQKQFSELEFQITLDTHPVRERDLAHRAGLGGFGKNSMLINRQHGSFFIIGSLLINQNLMPNEEVKVEVDHCGQCTRCIDICPTEAIDPDSRTIMAKDCISTFTIEQFKLDSLPSEKMNLKEGTIFGCDLCQDVCPWNKRVDRLDIFKVSQFENEKEKKIIDFFLGLPQIKLEEKLTKMSEGEFKRFFKNTSFLRSGKRGVLKNMRLYLKQLNIFS